MGNQGINSLLLNDNIKIRSTTDEKEKMDFARQKEIMDVLDLYYGDYRDYEKINKFRINYELLNGYMDIKLYEDPNSFRIKTENGYEDISFDYENISHTPLISQYGNAFIGEMLARPFKPTIKDWSPNNPTIMRKKAEKVNKEYIVNSVVQPIKTQILNKILKESGATDVFTLAPTPEMQMELDNQINQQVQNELPKDILDFINGNVTSTRAKLAQKTINYLIEKHDIAYEQIMGFKNAVVTAEEYYYAGEYGDNLLFEAINPIYINWGGGNKENEWVQHADWVRRERWLSYQQLISRHSDKIDPKHLELIDLDIEPIGGFSKGQNFWNKDADHTKKMMWTYSANEGLREAFSDVNIKTIEGRKRLFQSYDLAFGRYADQYGTNYSDYGIREAHFQWRDLRPMWEVYRILESGKKQKFYLPEHYEPTYKDHEVREVWKDQVWEGYKLGTFESAYVGIRPKPYQYKTIFSAGDVDFSYYGKKYSTHNNTTGNSSLIDVAKTSNKNFDIVLASLKKDMATNIGKVFTMFMNMKPEGWTFQMWIDALRNTNILMLDPTRNSQGLDPQFLKTIELSKMSDIAAKIQTLQFFKTQVALSMFFNDAREGQISQYANATNIQQNSSAVHNKTALFMEQHRKIVEKALTGFLNCSRYYYKENIEQASIFLDDTAIAELINSSIQDYEWLGVGLENSEEAYRRVEMFKQEMKMFIQNGASLETVMEITFADTVGEVKDIVMRETKRQQEEAEKLRQHQQQIQDSINQAKAQEKQMDVQMEMEKQRLLLESQEKRTLWDREKFKMQNDVDENKINDIIQKTLIEIKAKLDMKDMEIDLEKEKMTLKDSLERERLRILERQSKEKYTEQ